MPYTEINAPRSAESAGAADRYGSDTFRYRYGPPSSGLVRVRYRSRPETGNRQTYGLLSWLEFAPARGALPGCWPGGGFVASIERTAYPRFKRAVPVRSCTRRSRRRLGRSPGRGRQPRTPGRLLALVVLLKSCHRLEYFPVLAEVPPPVTEHIRGVR